MAVRSITATVGIAAAPIVLDGPGRIVRITNINATGSVTFRFDGNTAVVNADEAYVIPAVAGAYKDFTTSRWPLTISAISTVAATIVHVELLGRVHE
jgi:hypothetical protein